MGAQFGEDLGVHWVLYGLPPNVSSLAEGLPRDERLAMPVEAIQGQNSWKQIGYRGPAPPKGHGTHHYRFRLYALDAALGPSAGLEKRQLLGAMRGHVLAEAELVGTYER